MDDYAKRKYVIGKGSPESVATAGETALQAISNAPNGRDDPPRRSQGCTYCQRPNHFIRDCRVLQKHLRTGMVKEGTVLPTNFGIIERNYKITSLKWEFGFRTRCTFFVGKAYKLQVELASNMDLFQLTAKTITKTPSSALVASAPADDEPANALVAQPGMDPTVLLWHKRLGHPNFRDMQTMSRTHAAPGLAFSQAFRFPNISAHHRSKAPLDKVHSGINGPLPYPSLSGAHYFITFIDGYSRFMHLYVFRKATKNRFNTEVGALETQFNHYDPEVQRLQSDNGKEYEKLGKIIFDSYDTHTQFTNAYTPQQNGVAERRMRTILERVRALLIDGNLLRQLWGGAASTLPTLSITTPCELWRGKKPSLKYIKVFGCAAFALIPEPHRNKLEPRAKLCMFVGLPQNKKGYRLLSTTENRIVYSRDVTFKEDTFPTLAFLERATPNPLSTSLPRIKYEDVPAVYSKALLLHEHIDLEEEHTQHYTTVSLLAARYDPDPKTYKEAMRSAHASD
ncbi:LOW QUALITY PROTEIN: Integrase catalytic core protein [Phytophthora palmivora]|uniref:Integrase catalytic core protein n=1 Tax=Phytophthora palmivora TaxID=4796 RepID=A0A2P4XVZ6_9STRA|nr:LOW QUALITY PROTEIN: Integrase catalytic core protein [Phytophthora palmivora]